MTKKPKLFEDYFKDNYPIFGPEGGFVYEENIRKDALIDMLNDLAQKVHDLEEDNDYLRGWITELQHKMDFVMEEITVAKVEEDSYYYEPLKRRYEESNNPKK